MSASALNCGEGETQMENQAAVEASNEVKSMTVQFAVQVTKVKRKVYANHPLSLHQVNEPFGKCDYFAALGPDSTVLGFGVTWWPPQGNSPVIRRIIADQLRLPADRCRAVREALYQAMRREYRESSNSRWGMTPLILSVDFRSSGYN